MRAALVAALSLAVFLAACSPVEDTGPSLDRWQRVDATPAWHERTCPTQDSRTAVLVVAGQSNAGNHGEIRPRVERGDRVLSFHHGRCWIVSSPLPGATGQGMAYWDLVAAHLIDSGRYTQVVLATFAVAGSRVSRFAEGGDLHADWLGMLSKVQQTYRPTHILWHQGEADFLLGTTAADYEAKIGAMMRSIRNAGIQAPLHIATATRCTQAAWSPHHPLAQAQRRLARSLPGAAPGPDADAVWGSDKRFDDCHFAALGQEELAHQWARILLSEETP